MRAADFIVVGFDRGVLCGPEHGLEFGMSGQLEQVIVMSRVAAQKLTVALQQLDFALDCEHLLDKCSPKMQKVQNEGYFIFGAEGQLVLLEVLTEVIAIRQQPTARGRWPCLLREGLDSQLRPGPPNF